MVAKKWGVARRRNSGETCSPGHGRWCDKKSSSPYHHNRKEFLSDAFPRIMETSKVDQRTAFM